MRRPAILTAAVFAACALLAGCGEQPLPSPSPRPTTEVVPVLNGDQADRILERVVPAVSAADAAKSTDQLRPVLDGPALAARDGAYKLSAKDAALPMPVRIGGDRLSIVVPARQEWPRTVGMVTRFDADDKQPEVLLFTQASAREQYKLTAYAPMISRATFPTMPAPRNGTEVVAADDAEGLVMAPQDAVAAYATYLSEGAASAQKDKFSASAMTDAIIKMQTDSQAALSGPGCPDCFTLKITRTPNPEQMWSFRTQDGGVFVLAVIQNSTVMTSNGGSQITLAQELRALSGQPSLASTGTFGYQETVGLFIPPGGPRATISPIAYDRVAISSTIS